MEKIDAKELDFKQLNEKIRQSSNECEINNVLGQRYIANGLKDKLLIINGVLGNASCSFMNGATVIVNGNAQDAIGDTMNDGKIFVNGNAGDALGYAMRGGKIFIKGKAGYRAGVHIKEYKDKFPYIVIGETAGSFLGEYQAGGVILLLNINDSKNIVGNYACTGMHGGKMLIRKSDCDIKLPPYVKKEIIKGEMLMPFIPLIKEFCENFNVECDKLIKSDYLLITPDAKNPYKQNYVSN